MGVIAHDPPSYNIPDNHYSAKIHEPLIIL